MHWPPGLDATRFLAAYWQKRPLHIPGALSDFGSPLSGDELAGMSCEAEIESRLVLRHDGDGWELRHGPFEEPEFAQLPERGWTLLVQDVDKYLPEVAAVLTEFAFLPAWRLDDVMISYAAPGGSVGAHVDAYDVFLLQASGERRWELDPRPADIRSREDLPLPVLRQFTPRAQVELHPGDLLYLPPGVAHFGVGDAPSITWSIGFRAPSLPDLLHELANLQDEENEPARYADPDLDSRESRDGEISPEARHRAYALLRTAMSVDERLATRALGRAVTRVKPWLRPEAAVGSLSGQDVHKRLAAGERLKRHPSSRYAWTRHGAGAWLFADGEAWRTSCDLATIVAGREPDCNIGADALTGITDPVRAADVLAALVNQGSLCFVDGWENGEDVVEEPWRDTSR